MLELKDSVEILEEAEQAKLGRRKCQLGLNIHFISLSQPQALDS
jgi:hypothetical protein